MVHDGSANAYGAWSLPDFHLFKGAIELFLENMLTAVVGYIDERWFEFHQGIQVIVEGADVFALQRRQNLERHQGVFGLVDVINYFHFVANSVDEAAKVRYKPMKFDTFACHEPYHPYQ
jgi:hypothetical protein